MPWNDTNEPPWKAVQIRGFWRVTTDRGNPADEYDVESSGDEEVARLQAAAPVLLAACEEAAALITPAIGEEVSEGDWTAVADMLREAIAATKGGA